MARIKWDQVGQKRYETGVDHGVVYPMGDDGYGAGYAFDGLRSVSETPSGAEPTKLFADNIQYITLMSAETFGGSIGAYSYPPAFEECDGTKNILPGVKIGQQPRKVFAFSYRTNIGDDQKGQNAGYKIHIVYGALASPSEKTRDTINDSPSAIEFSWSFNTTPVPVTGASPTAHLELDSTILSEAAMAAIEDVLYGSDTTEPKVLLPDEVCDLIKDLNATPETPPEEEEDEAP